MKLLIIALVLIIALLEVHIHSVKAADPAYWRIHFEFGGPPSQLGWAHNMHMARKNLKYQLEKIFPNTVFNFTKAIHTNIYGQEHIVEQDLRQVIKEGVNMIVTNEWFHSALAVKLSKEFPSVFFVDTGGRPTGGGPRYTFLSLKIYQVEYILGYIAGSYTKTNKIGRVVPWDFPSLRRVVNAWHLGAKKANPNVKTYHILMNEWANPEKETGAKKVFKANDIDVVTGATDTGTINHSDMISTGEVYNWGDLNGDSVLAGTSILWNNYLEKLSVEAIRYGKYNQTSVWAGIQDYGPPIDITDMSVLLSKDVRNRTQHIRSDLMKTDHIFCGPLNDVNGALQIAAGKCYNDTQKLALGWYVEGTQSLGVIKIPKDVCKSGTYWNYDYKANNLQCHNCTAGTWSDVSSEGSCKKCPGGYYSGPGASKCIQCPVNTNSNEGAAQCTANPVPAHIWAISIGTPILSVFAVILIIIIAAIIISLLIRFIKKQRALLDMAENISTSIAVMDLENETLESLFKKQKHSGLEQRFKKIIENLRIYRPYLPDTLFADDEDEVSPNEESRPNATTASVHGSDVSGKSRSSIGSGASSVDSHALATAQDIRNRMKVGLHSKESSIMVVDFKHFHELVKSSSPQDLCSALTDGIGALIKAVKSTNGVIHAITGDKILCSWNAVGRTLSHQIKAASSALKFSDALNKLKDHWSKNHMPILHAGIGVVSGNFIGGNIGAHNVRSFSLIGPLVNVCYNLAKLNRFYKTQILTNKNIITAASYHTSSRKIDTVNMRIHEGDVNLTIEVYELLEFTHKEGKEWMYEIESKIDDSDTRERTNDVYNKGVTSFFQHDFDEAVVCFDRALEGASYAGLEEQVLRFKERMEAENISLYNQTIVSVPKPSSSHVNLE